MIRLISILIGISFVLISSQANAQSLEERDVKEIKSKSRLIVKEFEGLLNLVSNKQMFDSEVEEIIANSLDQENVNKLFKNPKVIIEDDINPDLISRKRNVEIGSYLSAFNLQYNKTEDFSVFFEDIQVSDVFKSEYYFVIASLTRDFKSTYSKDQKTYIPILWNIELEVQKNTSGKWVATISSITNSSKIDFVALDKLKVTVTKSTLPQISLASSFEEDLNTESSDFIMPTAGYDEAYYTFLREGEKAFNEERFDDALVSFEKAKEIKSYDSYATVMLGRSKRLYDVQLLNTKDFLISLYGKQATLAEEKGEIEIAMKRFQKLFELTNDSQIQTKINQLQKRILAKEDVNFFTSLAADKNLVKDLDKKNRGKNKNIEYDLGEALVYRKIYNSSIDEKDLKSAISSLNKLVKNHPDFIRARMTRAQINTQLKEYKKAIADYTYLIQQNPDDFIYYVDRGKVYLQSNSPDPAISDFLKATEINPIAPDGHFELGRLYYWRGLFSDAEYHFKQCINAQYSNPTFHYFYGASLSNTQIIKSLDHLKIARELDSEFKLEKQIEKELSDIGLQVEAMMAQGKFSDAEPIINKALEVNPNSIGALIQYSIFLKYKKLYNQAIPTLERLLTLNPNSYKIKYELADNYSKADRFDQSFSLFNQTITALLEDKKRYIRKSFNPNGLIAYDKEILRNYVGLGDLYFNNGKYAEAIEYYTKAKDLPNIPEEYFVPNLAKAYFNLNSIKDAQSAISYGLQLNPKNAEYFYIRGLIYYSQINFKDAVANLVQSALDSSFQDQSNFHLGLINYRQRNYENAFNFFKQISPQSEYYESALEHGYLIAVRNKNSFEESSFGKKLESVKANPNQLQALYLTRDMFQGNYAPAETSAMEILKSDPSNARLLYCVAMINFLQGKTEAGYSYLERCLRTKQLLEADLYIHPDFEKYEDRRIAKLIKDYF